MKAVRKKHQAIGKPVDEQYRSDQPIDYQLLFRNSLEQVVIFRPVLGADGILTDLLIQEVNPAFARLAGIEPEAAQGRLASQLFSGIDMRQDGPRRLWDDIAGVAAGGKAQRREVFIDLLGRYFLYHLFPLNDGLIALVGIDISAQKEASLALKEQQQRLSLTEAREQLHAAQVQIQHKLIESRERERQNIANHLHEGLLQTLIGIRYAIDEGLSIDQKEIRLAKLAAVQAAVQREIQNLRDYCNELRPPTLASFGLEKTIRAYTEAFQKKHTCPKIHLELAPDHQPLSEQTRLVLFRAYQELLKDAVSIPAVSAVWVRFAFSPAQAVLEVEDDGEGPRSALLWVDLARQGKLALASALNRVEAVGGQVEFSHRPHKDGKLHDVKLNGAKVRVVVPLDTGDHPV